MKESWVLLERQGKTMLACPESSETMWYPDSQVSINSDPYYITLMDAFGHTMKTATVWRPPKASVPTELILKLSYLGITFFSC